MYRQTSSRPYCCLMTSSHQHNAAAETDNYIDPVMYNAIGDITTEIDPDSVTIQSIIARGQSNASCG